MKRDFTLLYSELGLAVGCTLEDLKLAYRRRVAELHPDHGNPVAESSVPLGELASLYGSATRFHRRHGRLPGTTRTFHLGGAITYRPNTLDAPALKLTAAEHGEPVRRLSVATLVLPVVGVLVILLVLSQDWLPPRGATASEHAPQPSVLEIGMGESSALAIQGPPPLVHDDRWYYGSSWLQFKNGKLIDWFSSMDYPLKTPPESPSMNKRADSSQ